MDELFNQETLSGFNLFQVQKSVFQSVKQTFRTGSRAAARPRQSTSENGDLCLRSGDRGGNRNPAFSLNSQWPLCVCAVAETHLLPVKELPV